MKCSAWGGDGTKPCDVRRGCNIEIIGESGRGSVASPVDTLPGYTLHALYLLVHNSHYILIQLFTFMIGFCILLRVILIYK
jgi:hypothetical protein